MDTLNNTTNKSSSILPKYDLYNAQIGDKTPIVMLNSSRYYKEVQQALLDVIKDRTIYIIDFSFIASPYEDYNLSIKDAQSLLGNFFKANKIDKSILLSNMETFKYAIEMAISSPNLVEKLVCINPPISSESFSESLRTDLKRELRACTIRANHSLGAGFINQQITSVERILNTDKIEPSLLHDIKCPVSIAYDDSIITNDSAQSIANDLKFATCNKLILKDQKQLEHFLSEEIR